MGCDDGAPPPPVGAAPPIEPEPLVLRLAGTGSMIPLASLLAATWAERHGEPTVVVESSVGSTGGVRAAADGAVDLGLVARPLTAAEQRFGLTVIPVARDAVVVAANPGLAADDVGSDELVALYRGTRTTLRDGSNVTVLLRDRDDSAQATMELVVPGLGAACEDAYGTSRFRVLLHDDAMGGALGSTPGAIGIYSLGAIGATHLPLKVLMVDGVAPSLETPEEGSWRPSRDLAFVARPDRLGRARAFLSFVQSPEGAALARAQGYLPVGAKEP